MSNSLLQEAMKNRNDEFYTTYDSICAEVELHKEHFADKIVYCNCDDPLFSNFWKFFVEHFNEYKLNLLMASHIGPMPYLWTYDGIQISKKALKDGSYDSPECIDALQRSDVVITNPPFSKFADFISLLSHFEKDFLVLGNKNAYTYKSVFPLLKENKIHIGQSIRSGGMWMIMPGGIEIDSPHKKDAEGETLVNVPGVRWFSTLPVTSPEQPLKLTENYDPEKYPAYDNYKAINVDKTKDIPAGYTGVMGVPVSFVDRWCPEQFEIVGATESEGTGFSDGLWIKEKKVKQPMVNGKKIYKRIFIKAV